MRTNCDFPHYRVWRRFGTLFARLRTSNAAAFMKDAGLVLGPVICHIKCSKGLCTAFIVIKAARVMYGIYGHI